METIRLKYLASLKDPYPIGDGDHGQIKPDDYLDEGIPYIRVQNLSFSNKIDFEGMVYISDKVNKKNRKSTLAIDYAKYSLYMLRKKQKNVS